MSEEEPNDKLPQVGEIIPSKRQQYEGSFLFSSFFHIFIYEFIILDNKITW